MYLSYLKPFQKESFLDLSLMIANADHEFNVLEKDLIEKLCEEMGIEPKAATEKSINEILENLSLSTTSKEKKIILLELLGLNVESAEGVRQAQKAHQIMQKSFEIGAATYLDLRDSELANTAAQLNYYQAIYNYLCSTSQLDLLLGKEDTLNIYKKATTDK